MWVMVHKINCSSFACSNLKSVSSYSPSLDWVVEKRTLDWFSTWFSFHFVKMASASASKSIIGCSKGLIWDYFRFDNAECCSKCMVNVDGDGKIYECEAKVNGKFTINLKNHLRKLHPDILKELETKEREKKRESSEAATSSLQMLWD